MNRTNPFLLTLTFLFALATFPAHAETLTDQKIRSFISSLEALEGMEDKYDQLPDDLGDEDSEFTMEEVSRIFSSSVEKMKGHGMYDDMKGVVQQHGFSSPEQWGETGDRIFNAWSAIEIGQHSGQFNQEMAEAMKGIENNPNMSEAQKQQMREMMGGAMSAMDNVKNVPEADKQAVRPHMERLRSAISDDGDY